MFHDENRKDYDYYKVKHKDTLQWTMIQDDKKCVNSGKTTISSLLWHQKSIHTISLLSFCPVDLT